MTTTPRSAVEATAVSLVYNNLTNTNSRRKVISEMAMEVEEEAEEEEAEEEEAVVVDVARAASNIKLFATV